jgi:hypothetical protein
MMKGWKTWSGAIGTIALGIYEISEGQIEEGLSHIALGLGLLGLGHKMEKAA